MKVLSFRCSSPVRSFYLSLSGMMVAAILLSGCSLLGGLGKKGEPASGPDATPPPGYAPLYVQRIGSFSPDATDAALQITRVDATNPSQIKMYAHIIDSGGTYLSGGLKGDWRSWWCDIRDSIGGTSRSILKEVTIRETTEAEREPHAVALVMDHSGSMGEARAIAVQGAANDLIAKKKDDDALAFVKYDGAVVVEVPLTTSSTALRNGLQRNGLSGYGGTTAIGNGIQAGIMQVANSSAKRKAVIIFTDGLDNSSTIERDSVIALALREGVAICAVDFGENTSPDYLQAVARATGGSYYRIYQTSEFNLVFDDIYRRLRNYYVIEYTPTEYGQHIITARLCMKKETVETVQAYDNTPDIGAIALLNVYFDVAKADLKGESKPAIDNVYNLMRSFPDMKIELRGHTDSTNSTGDPDFNRKLSQQRADAVRKELVRRGVAADRVTAVGYGATIPVADNGTPEGRAKNRRTEFLIIDR